MSSSTRNQLSIVVRGRVLYGKELKEYAEKHGLCTICGLYQTHKKVSRNFIKIRMEPITVENDSGVTTVYKGYCIQPTCYTSVDQVKEMLGEKPRSQKRPSSNPRFPTRVKSSDQIPSRNPKALPRVPSGEHISQSPSYSPKIPPRSAKGGKKPFRPDGMFQPPPTTPELMKVMKAPPAASSGSHRMPLHHTNATHSEQPGYRPSNQPQGELDLSSHSEIIFNPEDRYKTQPSQECALGDSGQRRTSSSLNNSSSGLADLTSAGVLTVGSSLKKQRGESARQIVSVHPVVAELEANVSDGDYIAFLNALDSRGTEPHIILEGLRLFRYYLTTDQLAKPSSVIVGGDSWVKTLNSKVDQAIHDGQRDVVISGLLTFLTLSVLPGKYKKSMVKKGAVDLISKALNSFRGDHEVTELSCATLISLSLNEKDGLNARYPKIASIIRQLADIVRSSDYCGRELALRALYHLSNQRRISTTTGKAPAHDVRSALAGDASSLAIVDIIRAKDVFPNIVEAGMGLLWKLSVPKDEDDEVLLSITDDLIEAVGTTMQRFSSVVVIEAGCGILANLALREDFSSQLVQPAAGTICHFLSDPRNVDEALAICCAHTICNLLSNSALLGLILSDPRVMKTTLALMRQYPQSELVVEYGCLAIAHACRDDQQAKEYILRIGGFDLASRAFQDFVTSRTGDASMEVKDASLCSIATLSGCQLGSQQVIQSGLINFLEAIFAVEEDKDFRKILKTIVTNCRGGAVNGFASGSEGILRQQPELFPQLLQNAGSEDDVATLLQDLTKLEQSGMRALGNQGFDVLLSALANFRNSPGIQEHGCAILAEAYYYLPLTALNAPVQLPAGSWAVIHTEHAIETIHNAMCSHRSHSGIQNYACCALSNFLLPLSEQDASSLTSWVAPLLKNILDAMSINRMDEKVQKSGIVLFQTLSMFSREDDLKRWSLRILQQVFASMIQFPTDVELKLAACDLLMALQSDQSSLEFMGSTTGVAALLAALDTDNADVTGRASAVLASLLKTVYSASSQLMQFPEAIRKLIFCMTSNEPDPQIQINICSVLESLINFEDYNVRVMIAESGGLLALCEAMKVHGSNVVLVEHACRVLSFVIPSVDQNSIASMRTPLGNTFIQILESHVEHPEVESAAMDALGTCCGQDDYFKHILVNDRSLNAIVQSMTLELGSSELVRSGSSLLWILSGYGQGKQLIGECGGISVIVNGMLAHNQSTAVFKEGLTALKNLATFPGNKLMIEQVGGESVVMYALWIHYRDPQVIGISLSALNNIAVDSATRTVALMKEEIVEIVISAMKRFPTDEQVQKNVCFYLKSCSYLPGNIELMSKYGSKLIPLLQRGGANFPQDCQDRASSIITKIQQFQ